MVAYKNQVKGKNMQNPLDNLINFELASIEFVRDYIQLHFDGPTLTILNKLFLIVQNQKVSGDTINFPYDLVSCIGSKVVGTKFKEGDMVELDFSNDMKLIISLKAEDYFTVEGLIFDAKERGYWVW